MTYSRSVFTQQEKLEVCKIPKHEEIKRALWSINNLKSLGLDGMSVIFYKKHQGIVGTDIIRHARELFTTGIMRNEINSIMIVLLQKKNFASNIGHYRPISLYNLSYLDRIISLYHAAFEPNTGYMLKILSQLKKYCTHTHKKKSYRSLGRNKDGYE